MAAVATTMAVPTTTMAAPYAYGAYGGAVMETVQAPMTYAQAAPVQYATAGAVQYAEMAPQIQYAAAAPIVETMAAPQIQYAAAPQYTTVQTPSYVAPPVMQVAQSPIMAPQAPIPPQALTQGIPTPQQIAAQKKQYSDALDKQLAEAISTVQKETEIEKQMVKFNADKNIALYTMSVQEKLCEAHALEDERATIATLELKKAFVERNLQLSAQASGYTMDYQMKQVQTELALKQYQFQVTYQKAEAALAQDYNAQVAKATTGTAIR